MPRRKAAQKRKILADPLFHSEMLSKFINVLMRDGKKSIAEKVVYKALDEVVVRMKKNQPKKVSKKDEDDGSEGEGGRGGSGSVGSNIDFSKISASVYEDLSAREAALSVLKKALDNVTPNVEVKSRRVGGSTYQVPVEVRANRRKTLAMRWMVEHAGKRNEKTMILRLANEIIEACDRRGGAYKKREDVHRMAKANQAFSHLVRVYG